MNLWKKTSIRFRILSILCTLVLITFFSNLIQLWHSYQMETQLNTIVDGYMKSFQVAEALENALANQKGFVSYYFLDANP
ncbi:integral membrane sensor signal transduction histidine kinase [Candidatus Magnetomorum sp. HK-1]|nr:integral membrane sensor signal transduction histidine kinase [Candidatus Magnetomorum sp. HK-1]